MSLKNKNKTYYLNKYNSLYIYIYVYIREEKKTNYFEIYNDQNKRIKRRDINNQIDDFDVDNQHSYFVVDIVADRAVDLS